MVGVRIRMIAHNWSSLPHGNNKMAPRVQTSGARCYRKIGAMQDSVGGDGHGPL
jgi:hypothetical protein